MIFLRAALWFALAPLAAAAEPAAPDCAAIKDDAQRLACYDSAGKREPAPAPAPETAPAPAPPDSPPPAAGAPAVPARNPEEKFGAEQLGKPDDAEKEKTVSRIESHLAGKFRGWERGTLFKLENGQVWKCISDDPAYYPRVPDKPAVVIRRGFFTGSYWMEIAGAERKVKVERVR